MAQGIHPSVLAALLACGFLSTGCLRVPKETVELSYAMGQDIATLRVAHVNLIRQHFRLLRDERLEYVEDVWAPLFIRKWIQEGRLQEVAKGQLVWSAEKRQFVPPTAGKEEEQLLDTVNAWCKSAVGKINQKKAALLDPLDKQEASLLGDVDDAFDRLVRGNAAITAQLNSLRKVQEVQDSALGALNLKDLREKINKELSRISDDARKGLDEVRKADAALTRLEPAACRP
jgi:hypothetical protein